MKTELTIKEHVIATLRVFALISIIVVICMLACNCSSYNRYSKHLFVPEQQSKVKDCMGYPYIGHDVTTSMKYYYELRNRK